MGVTRNGSRPPAGEKGASGATSYLGDSLIRYGERRPPTVPQLDAMVRHDPWAEAIEGALTWPIRSAGWSIKEADGDRGEAEEARRQFGPLAERAIAGAVGAVCRRVAPAEQIWSYDRAANTVVLEDLAFRPQEQCQTLTDRNGRPRGFRQRAHAAGRGFVDEEFLFADRKAFMFFHDSLRRPGVGRSALEAAYQHHEDKQKILFYRYRSLEKYGGPSTHGKTGATPGTEEWRQVEAAVKDMRSGASVVTDHNTEIDYLAPPNAGTAFRQTISDLNFEMAVSAYVQFLALAQAGNSGAYALSRDHSDFLTIITEGRMNELGSAFTAGPIHDLTFLNFGPNAAFPIFDFEALSEHISKRILEAADKLFSQTGRRFPDWLASGISEGYARALAVEKPEGEDWIEAAPVENADQPNDQEEG